MAVGAVSFHSDKKVKRGKSSIPLSLADGLVHVPARDNAIVNRLNKTKVEKEVDHEQERVDRLRAEGRVKKQLANERVSVERRRWPQLTNGIEKPRSGTGKTVGRGEATAELRGSVQ